MAVVVGKGSFRGFDESAREADKTEVQCSPDQYIRNNLQSISRNTQQLKKMVESLGTSKDSRDLRNKISAIQSETSQLTKDTNLAVKQYGDALCTDDVQQKDRKNQHRLFVENFKDILKEFNEQQKIIRIKERDSIRSSLIKSGCFGIDVGENGLLYKDGEQIQIETIQAEIDLDLIKEKNQELMQLEQNICDINDIFKDLAGMIEEQGADIAKAAKNINEVGLNVQTAVQKLDKKDKKVTSSRRRMFILIIIVVAILLIVLTVVLAIALS